MGLDLVTLAEVKAYNNISSTNQDSIINLLIPQVSAFVKNYCNNTFIDYVCDAKTDIFSGGSPYLYLTESPIINLQSVEVSTDYGVTYTTLVSGTDYILDLEEDRVQVLNAEIFPKYINGYKVTYYAGYETLPTDLKLAVLELTGYYLRSDMAIKSPASIGRNSMAIEYITTSKLPSHISRVLDYFIQQVN